MDTTDPSIFLKDGKTVNYCNLPKLDGTAKSAILVKDEVMTFRLFNLFDTVSRSIDGEDMIFTFFNGEETRSKRICKYP